MIKSNLHTHTNYCDGKDSPREMVKAAIQKGFRSIGFSGHAYAPHDTDVCMSEENMRLYMEEISALQAEYAGLIDVFLGLEMDAGMLYPRTGYDYTIVSVHYVAHEGGFYCVDDHAAAFRKGVEAMGGDALAFVGAYFEQTARLAESAAGDILGHFDVVTKLNEHHKLFDMRGSAYRVMAEAALSRTIKSGMILEINTGGMGKGYRDVPYPDPSFFGLMRELNARIILSSDAHSIEHLDYGFAETAAALRRAGFKSQMELTREGFTEVEL